MMIILFILMLFCSVQAVRASHLMNATLWLAVASALVATMLYIIGAWQIAVIELSVGSGLVTVLMVFAITMIGNEREPIKEQRLPLMITLGSTLFFVLLTTSIIPIGISSEPQPLGAVMWQARGLDLVLQIVLIFSGVLGVIGLLNAAKSADNILSDFPSIQASEQRSQVSEKDAA